MDRAEDAACRAALRRAGLAGGQAMLARLLALLRAAPETHLSLGDVVRLAAAARLPASPAALAQHLETLADHGLLGRLPSTRGEAVFDTVPEPHAHLVDEATGQTIDLDVSAETLIAMVRQALAERPGEVEVMVRFRRGPSAPA
jgi:Fur family iron response transcriptional regulator